MKFGRLVKCLARSTAGPLMEELGLAPSFSCQGPVSWMRTRSKIEGIAELSCSSRQPTANFHARSEGCMAPISSLRQANLSRPAQNGIQVIQFPHLGLRPSPLSQQNVTASSSLCQCPVYNDQIRSDLLHCRACKQTPVDLVPCNIQFVCLLFMHQASLPGQSLTAYLQAAVSVRCQMEVLSPVP